MNAADDTLLTCLDAAAGTLTPGERARAARDLERILATDPGPVDGPGEQQERWRRPLVLAGAAAALAAGVTVLPGLDGEQDAYASWTASAQLLDPDAVGAPAVACRDALEGGSLDVARAVLVLAERRGELVGLLYRTDDPDVSGSCIVHAPVGRDAVELLSAAAGGGSGPAQVVSGAQFTEGALHSSADASITDGAVGPEVTGVTIHVGGGDLRVEATVAAGRYVAWWPGPAHRDDAAGEGVLDLSYDLTLADGTVLRDVAPTRPS